MRQRQLFSAAINGLHWIQCECSHCCGCGNGATSKWVWNLFVWLWQQHPVKVIQLLPHSMNTFTLFWQKSCCRCCTMWTDLNMLIFFKLNLKLYTSFRSEQYLQFLNTMSTYRPSIRKDREWEYWWAVQDPYLDLLTNTSCMSDSHANLNIDLVMTYWFYLNYFCPQTDLGINFHCNMFHGLNGRALDWQTRDFWIKSCWKYTGSRLLRAT